MRRVVAVVVGALMSAAVTYGMLAGTHRFVLHLDHRLTQPAASASTAVTERATPRPLPAPSPSIR